MRAWKHPEVLAREQDATRAWLYTVVRNLVIDDRRSARHVRERTTDADARLAAARRVAGRARQLARGGRARAAARPSTGPSSSARTTAAGPWRSWRTEHQIPEGTVKSRLHYALRALRLALQERGVSA